MELSYPLELAYGSSGTLEFPVDITVGDSGIERRTLRHAHPLREVEAATGIMSPDDLAIAEEFYIAVGGKAYGFRFMHPSDHSSAKNGRGEPKPGDQVLGKGTGTQTEWQLTKSYTAGPLSRVRPIVKPVDGSVRVAVGGTELKSGFRVDPTTGLLTLTAPPPEGIVVTAGFRFEIPMRFNGPFNTRWDDYENNSASLPLREIKVRLARGGVS
nr:DUF2460 domain-containing protein [Roseomonas sp. GC11]